MLQGLRPKRCIVRVFSFLLPSKSETAWHPMSWSLIIGCFVIGESLPICCQSSRPIGSPLFCPGLHGGVHIYPNRKSAICTFSWLAQRVFTHSALAFSWVLSSSFLCLHRLLLQIETHLSLLWQPHVGLPPHFAFRVILSLDADTTPAACPCFIDSFLYCILNRLYLLIFSLTVFLTNIACALLSSRWAKSFSVAKLRRAVWGKYLCIIATQKGVATFRILPSVCSLVAKWVFLTFSFQFLAYRTSHAHFLKAA